MAAAFQTLASQLSDITGGEDGLTFKVPELLSPSFEPFETEVLGVLIDGKLITYYLLFVTAVVLVLASSACRRGFLWNRLMRNVVVVDIGGRQPGGHPKTGPERTIDLDESDFRRDDRP